MAGANLKELLGETVLAKRDGATTTLPVSSLEGKYVAHRCPPCRSFTPLLRSTYQQLQDSETPLEVIFVSSDQSSTQFEEYYDQMPWCAVAFEDQATRRLLNQKFAVSGIPTLVMLGPDGAVVNSNARMAVIQDRTGHNFPWEGQGEPRQFGPWVTIAAMILLWAVFKIFFDR